MTQPLVNPVRPNKRRMLAVLTALALIAGAIFGYFWPVTGAGAGFMQATNVFFIALMFVLSAIGATAQKPGLMWPGWALGWLLVSYTILNWFASIVH